jgi:DNA-binding NarL/FixJ family response regulator
MNDPIRVLIVDDHEIVREGLRTLLGEIGDVQIVGEAANGNHAVELAGSQQPDVVLMDLVMPDLDGVQATREIHAVSPTSRVLILTSFVEDHQVHAAIEAGAIGYVLKDVLKDDLLHAIRSAARGVPSLHPAAQRHLLRQVVAPSPPLSIASLTERERDVLQLIASGCSNKTIAARLHLTEGTVKGYVSTILDKLGVDDRTQAALYAVKHGLGTEE